MGAVVGTSDITLTARDASNGDYDYVTQAGDTFNEVSGADSIELADITGEGVVDVTVTFTENNNYALAAVGVARNLGPLLSQGFIISGGPTEEFTVTVGDGENRIEKAAVSGLSFV